GTGLPFRFQGARVFGRRGRGRLWHGREWRFQGAGRDRAVRGGRGARGREDAARGPAPQPGRHRARGCDLHARRRLHGRGHRHHDHRGGRTARDRRDEGNLHGAGRARRHRLDREDPKGRQADHRRRGRGCPGARRGGRGARHRHLHRRRL
ncbi:MAG: hypothetical protein AVDCRST_MAG05-5063, partial [uncultured Rubrobacteraceae bacterium]